MSNHVHFIAVPMKDDSLARTFNTLHIRYSQYFNQKGNNKGHLWQGRFFSCVLDERHLFAAIRYIENNPVRAGIVRMPHECRWSSAKAHVYKEPDSILSDDCYLTKGIDDWLAYLMEKDDSKLINNIIQSTKTGRACGDETFLNTIEGILGRRLVALPRGRPRKKE